MLFTLNDFTSGRVEYPSQNLANGPGNFFFFPSLLYVICMLICLWYLCVCIFPSICTHAHTHTHTHTHSRTHTQTHTHTHTHSRAHNTHTHYACVFFYVLSLSISYKAYRADFVRLRGLTKLEKQIWSYAPSFHPPPTTLPFFFPGPQPAGNGADHAHVMWAKRQNGFRPFTGVDKKKIMRNEQQQIWCRVKGRRTFSSLRSCTSELKAVYTGTVY